MATESIAAENPLLQPYQDSQPQTAQTSVFARLKTSKLYKAKRDKLATIVATASAEERRAALHAMKHYFLEQLNHALSNTAVPSTAAAAAKKLSGTEVTMRELSSTPKERPVSAGAAEAYPQEEAYQLTRPSEPLDERSFLWIDLLYEIFDATGVAPASPVMHPAAAPSRP